MADSVQINDRTHEAVAKIRKLSRTARNEFVEVAEEITKSGAPYKTGNHRDLISHDEIDGGSKARLFSQSNYGAYLELGTAHTAPRPHFARGIQGAIRDFTDGRKWGG